jgi:hypothetical protein
MRRRKAVTRRIYEANVNQNFPPNFRPFFSGFFVYPLEKCEQLTFSIETKQTFRQKFQNAESFRVAQAHVP